MQKKLEELTAGVCSNNSSILQFSVEQLEFEVVEGTDYTGEFLIESASDMPVKGIVYSSSPRMECPNSKFQGNKITQVFKFHSEGLAEGDVQKGSFHIVSSQGEYDLPFSVAVSSNYPNSSVGKIKSIFDFANLARNSYEEAVKIFGQPEFIHVFKPQETEEFLIYQMLRRKPCTMAQVEEFLIAARKKKRVTFRIEEAQREFSGITEVNRQHITLKKEEWGFLSIEIINDAKWLSPIKNTLASNEFVGGHALVEYLILPEFLHPGKNLGRITLRTSFRTLQVDICVFQGTQKERTDLTIRKKQVELMNAYIRFGLRKMVTGAWAKLSIRKLEELIALEPDNLWYLLAKAQVFLVNKQQQEGEWALDAFPKHKVDKESPLYGYYLYLCALREPEPVYVNKLTGKIRKIFHKNQENNLLLWILLFLDEELNYSKGRKLEIIIRQIGASGGSSVLYLEAYRILVKEPFLLDQPDEFCRKVLLWAAKHQGITRGIAEQVCQLVPEIPEYHPIWYRILCECYEVFPEKEMLQAVCSYCMKWNCYGESYWKWYHKGVREKLRIAGIYEAWMMSAGKKQLERIPKSVILYFQYNNNLPYPSQAKLYRSMMEHKSSWKNHVQPYQKNMEEFVIKQLKAERIDEDSAVVYREILKPDMIADELLDHLAKILFTHKVTCKDSGALRLVVRQYSLKKEQIISLNHGIGFVNLYSSCYQILLEDSRGNRFLPEEELSVVPMLDSAQFLEKGIASAKEKMPYLLKYFDRKKIWQTYEAKDLPYLQMLIESENISETYREDLRPQIISYYYYNYTGDALDEFLLSVSFDGMKKRARERIMELLVARRHYKRAYELLLSYGSESISAPKLVYVICHQMEEMDADGEPDEFLLRLCRSVFLRGKYNERILSYMCRHFYGKMEEMAKLWQAACDFELDTYALEERCLLQFLYTGDFSPCIEKIFESYGENLGREVIVLSYLTFMSDQFLRKDTVVSDYVFQKIFRMQKGKQELNQTCRLGFLKWCSCGKELSKEEKDWAEIILAEYISNGTYFSFYKTLPESFAGKYLYHDKTFLEYHTEPGQKVVLIFLPVGGSDYLEIDMKEVYEGIYVKEFLVFYGEKIPYYIKEKKDGEWSVVDGGQIQNQELCIYAEGSRYDLINDMMVSWQMKDEQTLMERMETYGILDGMVREEFNLL
ncbi:hypothetical protein C806_02307 [Lachnospiraceae bacterium 3-1]|nr:hypothetical protein C806_02307 [Lachnospiraceae bacterium 3-1]